MKVTPTKLPEVLLLEPTVFGDARGFFYESFNRRAFLESTGLDLEFVQDNVSRSSKGVLRGLHYQVKQAQGKLVRCTAGEVFDVAVDIRRSSARFGRWTGIALSAENKRAVWVPAGFAHGFLVVSPSAEILYKTTDYYAPEHERSIVWNDADIAIAWPLDAAPTLSTKDLDGVPLRDAEVYA